MLRIVSIARIALVVTVFLAAGCQPVRPLAQTPEAPAATAEATAEVTGEATVEATAEVTGEATVEAPAEVTAD